MILTFLLHASVCINNTITNLSDEELFEMFMRAPLCSKISMHHRSKVRFETVSESMLYIYSTSKGIIIVYCNKMSPAKLQATLIKFLIVLLLQFL